MQYTKCNPCAYFWTKGHETALLVRSGPPQRKLWSPLLDGLDISLHALATSKVELSFPGTTKTFASQHHQKAGVMQSLRCLPALGTWQRQR